MAQTNSFLRLFDFEERELAAARPDSLDTRHYHNYEAHAQSQWVCSSGAAVVEADRPARIDAPGLVHIGEPGVETFPGWNTD